ncbi:hypothetical protein [Mycolicibacterium sp. A43C]
MTVHVSGPPRRAARTGTAAVLVAGFTLVQPAPTAAAEETVTYEVTSDSVRTAAIEYQSGYGRQRLGVVTLPWRLDVPIPRIRQAPPDGAQVRADWRPVAAPNRWVSVRVVYGGEVICQNTLDVGNAACYGITPRVS